MRLNCLRTVGAQRAGSVPASDFDPVQAHYAGQYANSRACESEPVRYILARCSIFSLQLLP